MLWICQKHPLINIFYLPIIIEYAIQRFTIPIIFPELKYQYLGIYNGG